MRSATGDRAQSSTTSNYVDSGFRQRKQLGSVQLPFLDQVEEWQPLVAVVLGDRDDQSEV